MDIEIETFPGLKVLLKTFVDCTYRCTKEPWHRTMAADTMDSLMDLLTDGKVIEGLTKTVDGLSVLFGAVITPESIEGVKEKIEDDEFVEATRLMCSTMLSDLKTVVPIVNEIMAFIPKILPVLPTVIVFAISLIAKDEVMGEGAGSLMKGIEKILEAMSESLE